MKDLTASNTIPFDQAFQAVVVASVVPSNTIPSDQAFQESGSGGIHVYLASSNTIPSDQAFQDGFAKRFLQPCWLPTPFLLIERFKLRPPVARAGEASSTIPFDQAFQGTR